MQSKNMGIAGALYSVFFMTIGTFIFINVIVGVTVTNLQDAYTEIKHVRRAKHRKLHRRHAGELQTRPIVKITHIQPDQWRKQIPVEKPKFSNITPSNLENYFLVLSAVEDNLVEFMNLKKEVEEIVSQVRDLNHVPTSEESSDPESELEEIGVLPEDDGDDVQAGPGDVLSAMIRRDAAKEGRSRQQKEKQEKMAMKHRRTLLGQVAEPGDNDRSVSPDERAADHQEQGNFRALLRSKSRQSRGQEVEMVPKRSEASMSKDSSTD
eukprot:TRINITY_DN2684_c0_g1_i4.p1 TRINITY_DN2684_c0_g1~~TRINITY_DN2684_c0_g1_i4.p1  ORF type:complete len:266 (+),score=70.34 TRINITY_DN2684_c0_g1_i4:477-1274(+)